MSVSNTAFFISQVLQSMWPHDKDFFVLSHTHFPLLADFFLSDLSIKICLNLHGLQAMLDVRIEILAALGEDGITRWLD